MTKTSSFDNIALEIIDRVAAIQSIPNYEEVEAKAKNLATDDYERNKENKKYAKIYKYFMERFGISVDEFIDILSNSYMIKFAIKNNLQEIEQLHIKELMKYRHLLENRKDEIETETYDFFTELITRNYSL